MVNSRCWSALSLSAFLVLFSCSEKQVEEPKEETAQAENIWATVNGSDLTDAELEYTLNRFFGDQFIDARAELKIRDSLIASRAIAMKAKTELSPEVLAQLEVAVNAYREERLIAAYIEATTTPEPVSAKMVSDYYQSHLEEFGAKTVQRLHILEASISKSKQTEAQLTKSIYGLSQSDNWSAIELPAFVKQYQSSTNAQLPPKLAAAIQSTAVGERSGIIVSGDSILVMKVLKEEKILPKPLSEVSASIRKRLAATQLSNTVKALTEQVVSESDVVKNY